jgi:Flp pilus assembly protein TadG
MKAKALFTPKIWKDEQGQVLPWLVLMSILFLGMAGLSVDLGHAYVCYRELQTSTDAATLAGAYAMTLGSATSSTVQSEVYAYSSLTSGAGTTSGMGANANSNLLNVTLSPPTLTCITNSNYVSVPCAASNTNDNVIQVTQTAQVPMYFIQAIKALGAANPSTFMTLSATSTAAIQSGQNQALNLAIIIDTTASMKTQDNDANCGNTRIYCALQGVQTLLGSLSPCSTGSTSSNCLSSYDQVSLFTFPNLQAQDAGDDTTCPTSDPAIPAYSAPPIPSTKNTTWTAPTGSSPTYQVTSYEDNYSETNASNGGLNTNSALAIASGANSSKNCGGLQAPGGDGTYIAGSMYAAITSLQAAQAAAPGSKSALILLTDGEASSSKFGSGFSSSGGTYPSTVQQCNQTVAAGQFATSLGITVYTVSYGASNSTSDCGTDTNPTVTPCAELAATASNASDFYSDATAEENKGACTSADNPNLNLQGIFSSIANRFTAARLIPNSI